MAGWKGTLDEKEQRAILLTHAGAFEEASGILLQIFQSRRNLSSGVDDPIINTLNNIAILLATSGQARSALSLFTYVYERCCALEQRGLIDPSVIVRGKYNYAVALERAGARQHAIRMLEEVRDYHLIANARNASLARSVLASFYAREGLYQKAADILWQLRRAEVSTSELVDIDLELGIVLDNWGMDCKSELNIRQAVELTQERLIAGCDKASELKLCNNLGTFFHHLGDDGAAKEWLRRAVGGYQRIYGVDHPSTLESAANLIKILCESSQPPSVEDRSWLLIWEPLVRSGRALIAERDAAASVLHSLKLGPFTGSGDAFTGPALEHSDAVGPPAWCEDDADCETIFDGQSVDTSISKDSQVLDDYHLKRPI